ncbi:MAG: tetratricopeptide repeat protein [Planctomycetota bacterium]|jgi:tetratricopeptide (TPR) repeat protein
MSQPESAPKPGDGKGKAFFKRAEEVAATGNWDFAIQMYVDGIRREPDNIERGHQPLREVSLKRKAQGGKPAGMLEKRKYPATKDAVESLANTEFVLAKDPGNVANMVAVFRAARTFENHDLINWIGDILLAAMREAKKPNKQVCKMLAKAWGDIGENAKALDVVDTARAAHANDPELEDMAGKFAALAALDKGKYEESFTKSIDNLDDQLKHTRKDQLVHDRDYVQREIDQARAEYEESPTVPGKVNALVDALLKVEEEGHENEAIDVLKKAYEESGSYRYKVSLDDIRIRQFRRRAKKVRDGGDKQAASEMARKLLAFEMKMYTERAKNYPTDLSIKFELGRRQLLAGKIDDAIGSLQEAQRDPKRRLTAVTLLGRAFAMKDWHTEAVETFERALSQDLTESRAKEVHYHLAGSLEAMGEIDKALEHLSRVAQIDYNYLDVRDRIEALRKKRKQEGDG